jgi:hypothetical protein
MGNYLSNTDISDQSKIYTDSKKIVDSLYLTKLRYWERDIQWKNWNINNNASNIPHYMKNLRSWEAKIQRDNYNRWNLASNIPIIYRVV